MELKLSVISNVEDMRSLQSHWDDFVDRYSESPFLLSGFVEQFFASHTDGLTPYYFVFKVDRKIVGIIPVGIGNFGFRYCRFQLHKGFQPEFVFNTEYESKCLKMALEILFRRMKCQFADFSLPTANRSLEALSTACSEQGFKLKISADNGRAVVPVNCSWAQFEKQRRHLRREFERTERRLKDLGQLDTVWFGRGSDQAEAMQSIIKVEETSWKKPVFMQKGMSVDPSIQFILDGCARTSPMGSKFDWGVAVLNLNRTPIAYSLFVEHSGHAYVCKTSYNQRYRQQGPGIYVNYSVVRELLNRSNIRIIDFMTNLTFSHKWASQVVPVNRLVITQGGITPILLRALSIKFIKTAIWTVGKFGPTSGYPRKFAQALYQ